MAGEGARLIGTVDEGRAFSTVHPGALYLHQGRQYRVTELDRSDRAAWVEPCEADEATQAMSDLNVTLLGVDDRAVVGRAELFVGAVEVTERVTGYQRRRRSTREVLETVALELPPSRLRTRAFWYVIDDALLADADIHPARVPGVVHAVEHAAIGMLPLFTICDRWDVGGLSTNRQIQTGLATIVIYDGYPGGAGIAELGFAAGPGASGSHPGRDLQLPVRGRLPVVRAVAQVRQPQRAARQGGGGGAAHRPAGVRVRPAPTPTPERRPLAPEGRRRPRAPTPTPTVEVRRSSPSSEWRAAKGSGRGSASGAKKGSGSTRAWTG